MGYELLEKILDFCSITDFEGRRKAIKDHIFMGNSVFVEMQELIDNADTENTKFEYIEHMDLIKSYQSKGISALDYFVSSYQLELCFAEFTAGFNSNTLKKDYLLRNPFLMDQKSINYINGFIDRQKIADTYITRYRYYRNLLKACRILGINEAFEEFDTPETKYTTVFGELLKTNQITDLITSAAIYKDIVASKQMRSVLHSYQAKFEKNQQMRSSIMSLWDYISIFQKINRQVWFWE